MNPYPAIQRIAFELSNRCVLAERHTRCPAHQKIQDPPQNVPAGVVWAVLDTIRTNVPVFSGYVYFHLYNEPMMDPRLFEFVRLAKRSLPHSMIQITTNAWNYDQTLHDELAAAGARIVRFSIYSKRDLDRLKKIRPNKMKTVYSVTQTPGFLQASEEEAWKFVLRKDIPAVYSGPRKKARIRCLAPYKQLCITSSGEVALCCMDWQRSVTFGNLVKNGGSLDTVLRSPAMTEAYADLRAGNRKFNVCGGCSHRD